MKAKHIVVFILTSEIFHFEEYTLLTFHKILHHNFIKNPRIFNGISKIHCEFWEFVNDRDWKLLTFEYLKVAPGNIK
jgi:hypothetical protein